MIVRKRDAKEPMPTDDEAAIGAQFEADVQLAIIGNKFALALAVAEKLLSGRLQTQLSGRDEDIDGERQHKKIGERIAELVNVVSSGLLGE